ncbi:Holliday junction branch migration protein RuvA [bacterium]|nr:Holliday junction branch migration protein RuvA [candidate division CSSED10-310 bacterium]
MIASLHGVLLKKKPDLIVISLSGFGLAVEIPLSTFYNLPEPGDQVFLHTHMLVREDAIRLFGFLTESELGLFKILIDINRIGPKLALAILSGISPSELQRAAIQKDSRPLYSIPGIGKKSADRILFEITDRLDKIGALPDRVGSSGMSGFQTDAAEVIGIMVNLGYKQKDVEKAIEDVLQDSTDPVPIDDLIRMTLKRVSGR